ncbi:MAG: aminopeptidase P family N-terminal domain-containing protein, partial [Acidobacteria bacterium Pan2503]|nr:aminopeptidase P family N-terminal domain-containing protein [Candidatus Acidoferrum panamensis]
MQAQYEETEVSSFCSLFMDTRFQHRRSALYNILGPLRIDTLVVTGTANWFYLTGFTGESGACIVSKKATTLITDGRFMVQAQTEARGIRLRQQKGTLLESIGDPTLTIGLALVATHIKF